MSAKKMKKNNDLQNVVEDKSKMGTEIPDRVYTEPEQDIPNPVEQQFMPTGTYNAECISCKYENGRLSLGFNLPKWFDNFGEISDSPTLPNGNAATRYYISAYSNIKVIGMAYGGFLSEQYDIATQYGKNTALIKGKIFKIRVEQKPENEIMNPKFPLKVTLIA